MVLIKRSCLTLATFLLLFSSCNDHNVLPAEENAPNLRALSVEEEKLVKSSNDFAFDLLKDINKEEESNNFMISPLSVSAAMAMTYNGAAGNTKEQIKNTLGFEGLEDEELNLAYKELQNLLLNMDKKTEFSIANSIWYRESLTLQDGFSNIVKENYDGLISPLNFDDPNAKSIINSWVEDKTQDKIKDLVKEVSGDHVMFLINAIYFKATWTYKFDKAETKPQDFYKDDGSVVKREMMYSDKLRFLSSQDADFQLLSLPYGNQQFYMSIILPRENNSLNDIINSLNADKISNLIENADTSGAPLFLPKFKLEYEKVLNNNLYSLGIENAFGNADFSQFFVNSGPLSIDKVNHKTFIEVDEEGTEAAAATSVGIIITSVPAQPIPIKVNRPFAFLIIEKSSENILFVGKIMDPNP